MHALRGVEIDHLAIMRYPSKGAFLGYATNNQPNGAAQRDEVIAEGFKLREAGLAMQVRTLALLSLILCLEHIRSSTCILLVHNYLMSTVY